MLLSASGLRSPALRGVSVEIRKGEILGLGGLVGQGQGSLLEALFGAHALAEGSIDIAGAPFERRTPRAAIAAGVAYVPQERKTEGLLLAKSVRDNITYAILRQLRSLFGLLDPRYEGELVRGAIARAKIQTQAAPSPSPISAAAINRRRFWRNGSLPSRRSCFSTMSPAASTSAPNASSTR